MKIITKSFKKDLEIENKLKKITEVAKNIDYECEEASCALPFEKEFLLESKSLAKDFENYEMLILVGIGGSNLGVKAVTRILEGNKEKKIVYADTLDSDNLLEIIRQANNILKNKGKVVVNGISKSGNTLETKANLKLILEKLKTKGLRNKEIILTSNSRSEFYELSNKNGYEFLKIPEKVGGRYSIFSNVGLFPLEFKEINCNKILEGAKKPFRRIKDLSDSVSFEIENLSKEREVQNNFMFSNSFEDYGKWLTQLTAESISKKESRKKIIPITTIGTTDLHSMSQLFYSHPEEFYHWMYSVKSITNDSEISNKMKNVFNAVIESFEKKEIPYSIIQTDKSEKEIGELLQFQMLKTILLANKMKVNAFNQPDVEEYKKLVRK